MRYKEAIWNPGGYLESPGLAGLSQRPAKKHGRKKQARRELPLLTPRQEQILDLIRTHGMHEIQDFADAFGISFSGANAHLVRLYRRLRGHGYQVYDLPSVVVFAFKPELLEKREAVNRMAEFGQSECLS